MSFSSKVKAELRKVESSRHCRIAEMAAINLFCGEVVEGNLVIRANSFILNRFLQLAQSNFDIEYKIIAQNLHIFGEDARKITQATHYKKDFKISKILTKNDCCKRAFIRGAFLCGGAITDPSKGYHLEFMSLNEEFAKEFAELFVFFGVIPKLLRRKGVPHLYLKDAEQIATVLNIMLAFVSLMELENCRVGKEVSNDINRISNFQAANTDKILNASAKHIQNIEEIQRKIGISALPAFLQEVALLRLENPLFSLTEIGERLNPPISKFGVIHRLKKIEKIKEELECSKKT